MGSRLIGATLVFLLAVYVGAAEAAEEPMAFSSIGGGTIIASGGLRSGDAKRFAAFLGAQSAKVHTVLLHSPGGSLGEGFQIGRVIRKNGLATKVGPGDLCASACVFMLAGGVVRDALPASKVGVQMASRAMSDDYLDRLKRILIDRRFDVDERIRLIVLLNEQAAAQAAAAQATYLSEMGISLRLLTPSVNTNHMDAYWLSRDEMRDFNLVNNLD